MMRTFDKKKPRPKTLSIFLYSSEKPRETGIRGPCGAPTFSGVIREFFFFNFKDMSGKGTITISGGKNSLIQKL
jgi:hypothetical protein